MSDMSRTLLVTNDFAPTVGGIQSYLRDFVGTLDPREVVVFASTQDPAAAARYDAASDGKIIRWPRSVMLPTPATEAAMTAIIREFRIETVWFGAAAPLGLMAPAARKAGARTIIASTHGHEVGWSMTPGARQALRRIGNHVDTVTYISDYTRGRIEPALGPHPEYVHLPSGVDSAFFRPASAEERARTRHRFGWGDEPLVVCISRLVRRKGQDQLIAALPQVHRQFPDARLVIVGTGPEERRLRRLADDLGDRVVFTGALEREDMRDVLAAADVFSMPARTRGAGLDVEGLGIVYLEAQACGVPVVAGDSGGAPEAVHPEAGEVVSGRSREQIAGSISALLADPGRRAAMGEAGRRYVSSLWTWERFGARLRELTTGP